MFIQIDSNTMQVISILTDTSGVDMTQYIYVNDEASVAIIKSQMIATDPIMRMFYDAKKKTVSLKVSLAALKEYKIKDLAATCMIECEGGYTATALETAYLYPSKVLDQQNLLATYVAAQLDKTAILGVLCAKLDGSEWAMRDHTFDQLMKVVNACTAMTAANRAKYNTLRAQVENSVTQEAIEAIKW